MNKFGIGILLSILIFGSGLAFAISPADSWTVIGTGRYTGASGAANVTTQGGNVTHLDFTNVNVSTSKWAGYWGNLTNARLVLADGRSMFYTWTWTPANGGVVCAVAAPSGFNWGAITTVTAAQIDSMWSFGTASDNAVNTLTNATCNLNIGGIAVANTVSSLTGVGGFTTCAVSDGAVAAKSDFAFCSNLSSAGTLFNGQTGHYELMAPTNKTAGTTETHFFWLEMN